MSRSPISDRRTGFRVGGSESTAQVVQGPTRQTVAKIGFELAPAGEGSFLGYFGGEQEASRVAARYGLQNAGDEIPVREGMLLMIFGDRVGQGDGPLGLVNPGPAEVGGPPPRL